MSDRPGFVHVVTADSVLERINARAAVEPGFSHRLIGWLCGEAPEIVAAVLDRIDDYDRTHRAEVRS